MDVHSIPVMTSILTHFKDGGKLESPETRLNTPAIIDITSAETRLVSRTWDLTNNDDFDAVGIININGPITKHGGTSSLGMAEISSIMKNLSRDSRVKSFVILTDSGGGSSAAVQIMVDTIQEVKKEKPVIALVTKGGMAASAAYGIISACDEIYCEDDMAIVGSVGTMIQFDGREANSKAPDGTKHIRLYATKSTKKNQAFEQALNDDNYKLLINKLLDPINENFINMVSSNRPLINAADFNDGETYFAKEVIGTYIDGIKSFEEVLTQALSYKKNNKGANLSNNESNINSKTTTMTKEEFKAANPEAYNEIIAEGIAQRADQVGAWLAHHEADPTAVAEGIRSGNDISATAREELYLKGNSKKTIEQIKGESAKDLSTIESKTAGEEAKEGIDAEVKAAFDFELK